MDVNIEGMIGKFTDDLKIVLAGRSELVFSCRERQIEFNPGEIKGEER